MEPTRLSSELTPPEFSEHASHSRQAVTRWRDGVLVQAIDQVAEEVPVAMVYNGISHAVMLATPASLEQFGLGFSLSEGLLRQRSELYDLEIIQRKEGIELQMTIAAERFAELKQRRRNLTGRTGCGLCGTESLQQVCRTLPPISGTQRFFVDAVHAALRELPQRQALQATTGAVHAAAWAGTDGTIRLIEEDIGRHNALDKLIGAMALQDIHPDTGFAIVTSRASYEMVQKAATAGFSMLIAVSAPTALAIDMAQKTGLTLAGFARNGSHVTYSHPQRLFFQQD